MIELPPHAELMKLADNFADMQGAVQANAAYRDDVVTDVGVLAVSNTRDKLESAVRAYGEACARAAIEAAAKRCEDDDSSFMEDWPSLARIADNIRALAG